MKHLSLFIYKICGWKFIGHATKEMDKCVMIVAPHTSIWDFVWGRLGLWILQLNARFIIKKEFFKPPFGTLMKKLGGIPVDRGKKNNLVQAVVNEFEKNKKLTVVVTPEGTRKYTRRFKRGFYEIALAANVPIVLAFVDYKRKEGGVGPIVYPSGDYEKDVAVIRKFFADKGAKFPENYCKEIS